MRAWIPVTALFTFPTVAKGQQAARFCPDPARIIAAARETPPFASLAAAGCGEIRLGEAQRCVALREG